MKILTKGDEGYDSIVACSKRHKHSPINYDELAEGIKNLTPGKVIVLDRPYDHSSNVQKCLKSRGIFRKSSDREGDYMMTKSYEGHGEDRHDVIMISHPESE